jgi:integrase/recombinase XerC
MIKELAVTHPVTTTRLAPQAEDLIPAFLSGRNPQTLEAYRRDLEAFARFIGTGNINGAARQLLSGSLGEANHLALTYRNHLTGQKLSPATINRRLSALRSLVQLARTLGMVTWKLEVQGVKSVSLRDTRGCGLDGFRTVLRLASAQRNAVKAVRDTALLRLLFDLGLRRSEVVALQLSDVDVAGKRVTVLGKGRTQREPMTLPDETRKALEAWLAVRGTSPGPLFTNCDRAGKGSGLTASGVYTLVRHLGGKAKVKARPHGLRHAAITALLDLLNGNVRVVQKFARHADPSTTMRYDDNRRDDGGQAAAKLAASV